jgi:hypothetical protein
MKRNDFIKSLQSIKKRLQETKSLHKKYTFIPSSSTKTFHCTCKDANGDAKYLYASQNELDYMLSSKETRLKSYHCPFEKGWHLTRG